MSVKVGTFASLKFWFRLDASLDLRPWIRGPQMQEQGVTRVALQAENVVASRSKREEAGSGEAASWINGIQHARDHWHRRWDPDRGVDHADGRCYLIEKKEDLQKRREWIGAFRRQRCSISDVRRDLGLHSGQAQRQRRDVSGEYFIFYGENSSAVGRRGCRSSEVLKGFKDTLWKWGTVWVSYLRGCSGNFQDSRVPGTDSGDVPR